MQHENFTYDPAAIGGTNAPATGHYHVLLDGSYHWYGSTDFFNLSELPLGATHTIRVELHNNDHSMFAPAVWDEISVTSAAGSRELRLDPLLWGASVNASSVAVDLTVLNLTLNGAAIATTPVSGEGHYHPWLDGVLLGPTADDPLLLSDLSEGNHILIVELRQNNHAPFSPRVVSWTQFNVIAGAPKVTITTPPTGSLSLNSSSIELAFTVANFTLDGAQVGGTNVPGTGHWHLLIDGIYQFPGATGTARVENLAEGVHTIHVGLYNNDHTALTWPAFDTVRVTVVTGAPRVQIVSPADAATINASSLSLTIGVGNFVLSAANFGSANAVGEGHWHFYADGFLVSMGTDLSIPWVAIQPGTHTLRVQLANNDHTALPVAVWDEITVTVPAGRPWIRIESPVNAASVNSTSIWVDVTVANFTLNAGAVGAPNNVHGEGHYHLLVDGNYVTAGAGARAALLDLTPGVHTLRAELRNNDHSPLADPAWDTITIRVLATAPGINITSPLGGSTVALNWTMVTVTVTNLVLDPAAIGSSHVSGAGHYHLFVDGVYKAMAGATASALIDLAPGTHVILVELRNNDHSPLADPVWDEVTVTVTGAKPSIAITSPTTGAIIWGNSTTVSVAVLNFTMDASAVGGASVNGRGHLHVYVDGVYKSATAATTLLLADLAPGDHWINVSLNNNDHSALGVPQGASVFVHVAKLPSIRISQPASGLETANTSVTITVIVTDFTLDPLAVGGAPAPGKGHYHVFVDNVYVGATGATTFTVTNLTAGNHTISVRPFNNDHTEVPGTQPSSITVRVTAAALPPPSGFLPGPGAAPVALSMALAAVVVALAARRRRA